MRSLPRLARPARILLVVCCVAYGALLRLDAVSQSFDPVTAPAWVRQLQLSRAGPSALRPARVGWGPHPRFEHKNGPPTQYRGDPYTYLIYARAMRSPYAAHYREPLFPFATKVSLRFLHDSDVAVSFASAGFSILAIVLTFCLGAEVFGYSVGLAAALLVAIEFDVITSSAEGGRDDAFTCAVVGTAWAMLRLSRKPTAWNAALLGAIAGAGCLVRVTALSFLVPGFTYLLFTMTAPWRMRLRTLTIASAVALVVAAPYFVNCWRAFGDPLYAINVHADIYAQTEGHSSAAWATSARAYIGAHLHSRPIETLDTIALGLTEYPFANKWRGFDAWLPGAGRWLAVSALAGLALFVVLPAGRLLLVVLVSSLVPFAVTWRLIADWRFTEHAYPFLLIAACCTPWAIARAFGQRRELVRDRARVRASLLALAAVVIAAAAVWGALTRMTPRLIFIETLGAGERATIFAGDRDTAFFTNEWRPATSEAVPTRGAPGPRATIKIPLRQGEAYHAVIRVDSSTAPVAAGAVPQPIQLLLNGRFLAVCEPASTPERIGACRTVFPADAVRAGINGLTLVTDRPSGFRVWYVRMIKKGRSAP
jgi:hypothetical protein